MNSKKIIGIIELGDLNINCLIANTNNNEAEILSTSTVKSEGFNNNVVTNLSKATKLPVCGLAPEHHPHSSTAQKPKQHCIQNHAPQSSPRSPEKCFFINWPSKGKAHNRHKWRE